MRREFTITVIAHNVRTSSHSELRVPAYVSEVPGLLMTPTIWSDSYDRPRADTRAFLSDGYCNLTHHRSGLKIAGPFPSFEAAQRFAKKLSSVCWDCDEFDMDVKEAQQAIREAKTQEEGTTPLCS